MAIFPFGLVVGFTITALPFLLTNLGIPLDQVAGVSATVMSPTFWGFLLQPLMDTGLTRRAYCWLTAVGSAICLASALIMLSPAHLPATTALLLAGGIGNGLVFRRRERLDRGVHTGPHPRLGKRLDQCSQPRRRRAGFAGRHVFGPTPRSLLDRPRSGRSILLGTTPTILFPNRESPPSISGRFSPMPEGHLARLENQGVPDRLCALPCPGQRRGGHQPVFRHGQGLPYQRTHGHLDHGRRMRHQRIGGRPGGRLCRRTVFLAAILYLCAGMAASCVALALAFAPHTPLSFIWGVLLYNGIAGVRLCRIQRAWL